MNTLLLNDERRSRFYNCTFYAVDDIPLAERQHFWNGALFLVLFAVAELLYLPCVAVMLAPENRREPCYKLMLILAFLDLLNMFVSGFFTGYYAIRGDVYCSQPLFIYLVGSLGLTLWAGESMASVILAFNRCVTIWNPSIADRLFHGWRIYAWMSVIVVYMIPFLLFSDPPVYSSVLIGWFFNPHVVYHDEMNAEYGSVWHTMHDSALGPVLCLIYGTFFVMLQKRFGRSKSQRLSRHSISTFFQVLIIAILHIFACLNYIYMQFWPSHVVTLLGSYGWFLVQGLTPVIYLVLNKCIRQSLYRMISGHSRASVATSGNSTTERTNTIATAHSLHF